MRTKLHKQLAHITRREVCHSAEVYESYIRRMKQDRLLRSQDPASHFCVYFLPYHPPTNEVFLVHHKKSGLWLSPGGHVEPGETLEDAVRREAMEELHVSVRRVREPFLLTRTDIDSPTQECKSHYDVWYLLPMKKTGIVPSATEFTKSRWVSVQHVDTVLNDVNNLAACAKVAIMRDHHMLRVFRYSHLLML